MSYNCESCKFWQITEPKRKANVKGHSDEAGEYMGECRKVPPVPAKSVGGDWRQYASTRAKGDGCYQHELDTTKPAVAEPKPKLPPGTVIPTSEKTGVKKTKNDPI